MTVHFIGAGPGAPDLLTLRGARLIAECPVCVYAGSLVPAEVLEHAPEGARLVDTQHLSLDEIVEELRAAHARGDDVARLHSGDLSIYSALGEQTRRLDELGIPWDVTPGVPAFAAAAAALRGELTLPGVAQTVILTRHSRQSTAMPAGRGAGLAGRARHDARAAPRGPGARRDRRDAHAALRRRLPGGVVARASWPDELILTRHARDDRRRGARGRRAQDRDRAWSAGRWPPTGFAESHLYSSARERPSAP